MPDEGRVLASLDLHCCSNSPGFLCLGGEGLSSARARFIFHGPPLQEPSEPNPVAFLAFFADNWSTCSPISFICPKKQPLVDPETWYALFSPITESGKHNENS